LKDFFYIFIFLLVFPLDGSSQSSGSPAEVYTLTEQTPEYPGGMSARSAFLSKNMTISSVDKVNKIVSSTFSFVSAKLNEQSTGDTLRLTNGVFTDINFVVVNQKD
jgi:hypothetical protein